VGLGMARATLTILIGLVAVVAMPFAAMAAEDGAKVRGKSSNARRGGYSYNQADSINTYGDSRGRFGSANSLRDPSMDRQTNSGPFDHGFFYSSGMGLHGGDSPYLR
jgi:hypothetical protein